MEKIPNRISLHLLLENYNMKNTRLTERNEKP
jgi:hypothetical protein